MRRIISVLGVLAIMAAILAVSAVPAFAQPDLIPNPSEQGREHISCAGEVFAGADPGVKGPVVRDRATEGGKDFGKSISSLREIPREFGCDLGEDEDL